MCVWHTRAHEQQILARDNSNLLLHHWCLEWYWYPCELQQSWAWQKLKVFWKTKTGKKTFWKSTDVRRSYLLTSTGHTAHLGCLAGAGLQVTSTDVSKFSKSFLSCVSFLKCFQILPYSTLLRFARVSIRLQAPSRSKNQISEMDIS